MERGPGAGRASERDASPVRHFVKECQKEVNGDVSTHNKQMREIFDRVTVRDAYNYVGARVPVPSGLNIQAWKRYLDDYRDPNLVKFLEFGWPVNFDRQYPLLSTFENHGSARHHPADIEFYIQTELGLGALLGPFAGPPVAPTHLSPLMTRPKKGVQEFRRVIMDLSWLDGAAVNNGVDGDMYVDGPAKIRLPTVDFMEERLLSLGQGAYMYKTDLARGYRQLRVDPVDWPLLGLQHQGKIYLDVCPPFGLKSSAMCMQRTTEAISYIHAKKGYSSRPYLDDFGGAEASEGEANNALQTLQGVMRDLGIQEALHKVCQPAQSMIWLGILFNSIDMTMSSPPSKLEEVMETTRSWQGRSHATRGEMQSLLGLLTFVASVSPTTRIFTNRMLQNLRDTPLRGTESLSYGFKKDFQFFNNLLPQYNGVKIMVKDSVECQQVLELDACLVGCGAFVGQEYYSERFPERVLKCEHTIAHLEMLNVVVAMKTWARVWRGKKVRVYCDNSNSCLAIQTGRSKDDYMQGCIRELFMYAARFDVELAVLHRPGVQMRIADALSRAGDERTLLRFVQAEPALRFARRRHISEQSFDIENKL